MISQTKTTVNLKYDPTFESGFLVILTKDCMKGVFFLQEIVFVMFLNVVCLIFLQMKNIISQNL